MDSQWFKARLKEKRITHADLAEHLGRERSVITKMLAGSPRIQLSDVPILARLFGVDHETILFRAGIPPEEIASDGSEFSRTRRVQIVGEVEAGIFREANEYPVADQLELVIPVEREWQGFPLRALKIRGPSMNAIYPEGTYVVFVPVIHLGQGWTPRNGKRYIVQRKNSMGQYETTVKEFIVHADNTMWLYPRSFDKSFQSPWPLSEHWNGNIEDDTDEIRIIGLVVNSVRPE